MDAGDHDRGGDVARRLAEANRHRMSAGVAEWRCPRPGASSSSRCAKHQCTSQARQESKGGLGSAPVGKTTSGRPMPASCGFDRGDRLSGRDASWIAERRLNWSAERAESGEDRRWCHVRARRRGSMDEGSVRAADRSRHVLDKAASARWNARWRPGVQWSVTSSVREVGIIARANSGSGGPEDGQRGGSRPRTASALARVDHDRQTVAMRALRPAAATRMPRTPRLGEFPGARATARCCPRRGRRHEHRGRR